jgi:hypothetical protein
VFGKIYHYINHKRVFIFPALITVLLLSFTVFGVSGSSVGVYDHLLGEKSDELAGTSRTIRSDEWAVNTPFVISQSINNFPLINHDIGDGQDMSLVIDVPYKDWSVLFHPQNIVFFLLPLDNAFAFKWWSLAWLLMISVYLLVLLLLPRRYLAASLLAVFMCLSPFIQWWYQSITVLPVAYGVLAVVIATYLLRATPTLRKVFLGTLLSYIIACFIFIMYPAFQISVALVALGIFMGIYLSERKLTDIWKKKLILRLIIPVVAGIIPIAIFYVLHNNNIQLIQDTVYPGARSINAGGANLSTLTDWPLNYKLLRSAPDPSAYGANQSEASRFLFFGLLLIPLLLLRFFKNKSQKDISKQHKFIFIGMLIVGLIFVLHMYVPVGSSAYKLLGLRLVPHARLLVGFGIMNLVLLAIAFGLPSKGYKKMQDLLDRDAFMSSVLGFAFTLAGLLIAKNHYVIPSLGIYEIGFIAIIVATVMYALSHKILRLRYLGLCVVVVLSVGASLPVHPLYHGMGSIEDSDLSAAIRNKEKRDNYYWITTDKLGYESIPVANGAEVLTGVYTYPQLKLWKKYFPDNEDVFNRYAHVKFEVDDATAQRSISLLGQDAFLVKVSSCDSLLKELRVGYIIANDASKSSYQCFTRSQSFPINGTSVGIFEYNPKQNL